MKVEATLEDMYRLALDLCVDASSNSSGNQLIIPTTGNLTTVTGQQGALELFPIPKSRCDSTICFEGVSYNQPKFWGNAQWNPDAITIVNGTLLQYSPTRIFINTNNTWYVADESYNPILSGIGGSAIPTTIGYGGHCIIVTDNGDVYTYDDDNNQVTIQTPNGTNSSSVMIISDRCDDLYVTTNNTLYCSIGGMDQVVTKSLTDPTNTLSIVAGTGCVGSGSDTLAHPAGIFVTLNLSLYVADCYNSRIQLFHYGQANAMTMAGDGAPGTISLNTPTDVILDGNGYLFIVDQNNHRIVGSGPNGFRCVAGCTFGQGSASNQLSQPQSMSFDSDGNIWVADTSNSRIQKFVLKNTTSGTCCVCSSIARQILVFLAFVPSRPCHSSDTVIGRDDNSAPCFKSNSCANDEGARKIPKRREFISDPTLIKDYAHTIHPRERITSRYRSLVQSTEALSECHVESSGSHFCR